MSIFAETLIYMVLDGRIKRYGPDHFRFNVVLEDIIDFYGIDVIEVEVEDGVEEVAVFVDGSKLIYPYMPYTMSPYDKIQEGDDKELDDLIHGYLYINDTIGPAGINKMADFISRHHLYHSRDEPSYGFDEVVIRIRQTIDEYDGVYKIVSKDRFTLFKNFSKIDSDKKREVTNKYRSMYMKGLYGDILHQSTIYTIENIPKPYVITKKMISENTKRISNPTNKDVTKRYFMSKYFREDTVEILDRDGKRGREISYSLKDKYDKFLELPEMSVRDTAKELHTSFKNVLKFRRLKDESNDFNLNR